jgi:23S rRNA (uracil1939-C5)-methyltransferase
LTELSIARLVAGGDGLGFIDGKAVFVPGVLPGERVRVRITQRRADYDRAALLEVLEASPHRVSPGCRFAGHCGGCDWLHISHDEQLRQKISIMTEALRRTGHIEREDAVMEPSEPWRSRNRAQVHRAAGGGFRAAGGGFRAAGGLGYMGARSTQVVAVDACPIVAPSIEKLFRGEARPPAGLERFTVFGDEEMLAIEGCDDSRDLAVDLGERRILFSVGCFFQSNLAALRTLVPWALEGLAGGSAADLYCGVGLFGSFLAERFERIICVESSAMSIAYARRNVTGAVHEFYPMSVEQWVQSGAAPGGLDAVVVDPPRAGLGAEVREWLERHPPRKLVYVSCNPVTLARDLGSLTAAGAFALEDLRLFDFYPQTSHVEAVAKLVAGAVQSAPSGRRR